MTNLVGALTLEEIEQQALLENKAQINKSLTLDSIMTEELKNQELLNNLRERSRNIPPWQRVPLVTLNHIIPESVPLIRHPNIFLNNMQALTSNLKKLFFKVL